MKSLLAQEQKESKRRSPSIVARLMGLDVLLPPQSQRQGRRISGGGSLRRSSKGANLTQAEMEAKRLSRDQKLGHALEALDSNKDLLLKFLQHPDSLFTKHLHDLHKPHARDGPHTRNASYETFDLPNEELQPTKIVVLKPHLGEARRSFASPSYSSDDFRADRRLPCTSKHCTHKSNQDIRISRQNSRDFEQLSKAMTFETWGFRGYAGDESSSGCDSELVQLTSRPRTAFNRKNCHPSLPSKSATSSVSREAKRRLSERWKLTHNYEQEIETSRSGTLSEMLATSDREARPASFNGLIFEEGISRRFEDNVQWSEFSEPVGISSRDGWKGSWTRKFSKTRTVTNQENASGHTIVLPKGLINRDGLVKGTSSRHRESFFSSKCRAGSNKSYSSYNSSPEVSISPSLSRVLRMNDGIPKEKLSPFKVCSSLSVDESSDTEDGSASDDIKTAMSSEAPDLSTVTSLTDPDISRRPTEDVNHSSVPEPQSRESSKEGDQPSPVSVLEASFNDDASSSSDCFESANADLQGLRMQLQLLKLESAAYNECDMLVSSDEDTDEEETCRITEETMVIKDLREEDWKSLYLVDLLASSSFSDSDHNTVMETPVDPSLFEDLEKKYWSMKTSSRLERKFLFDQINRELIQILKQFSDPHPWVKPIRVCKKWDTNRIVETLRGLVTRKEEKPSRDDVDEMELQWLNLEDDIEIIGRNIEEMVTDELIAELVVGSVF